MWSGRNPFLSTSLSNSETLFTPSSYSGSKAPTVRTVSISKTNNGVKPQNQSQPNTSAKPYTKFKSCDVNNVLQTIRRFDQKYSLKSDKHHEVIPAQNDILPLFRTDNIPLSSDTNSRRGTNMSLKVKPDMVKSRLLQSPYSSLKSSHEVSRLLLPIDAIPLISRKGILKNDSFDVPENSEFDNNNSELTLKNPLTNVQNSSHNEMQYKSDNDIIQEEARLRTQTAFTGRENISFELNDRASESSILPHDTTSKLEVQSEEMLNKSQISRNLLSEVHYDLTSREYFRRVGNIRRTQQTSRVPASEKTGYQVSPKESQLEICCEINSGLSDDSVQERSHTGQVLPSSCIPTLKQNTSLYPTLANTKKLTHLESSQENSIVPELSSSHISSTSSHGFFKSLPYKILTIEDLVDALEVQKVEEKENLDVQRGVKGSKENRTVPAHKVNFNNDTRKIVHSESEQKTTVESQEEVNDEIEEELEEDDINATSINDLSVKTNSSYEEMMDQLSSHCEFKYTVQQGLSKEESISSERTNISPRSLSSHVVSDKSQQEGSDVEDVLSSSVKLESMNKIVSTSHGSDEPSLAKSSSHLNSEDSGPLRPNSNETEIKYLEDTKYCSIGIQTDINVAYPELTAKNEIQQSSYSQPVMHSEGGETHSFQEITPVYRYYSRIEKQG